MSNPALKTFPAPVMTMARTRESPWATSRALKSDSSTAGAKWQLVHGNTSRRENGVGYEAREEKKKLGEGAQGQIPVLIAIR